MVRRKVLGTLNYKQKSISNKLILQIKKYQKQLQLQENIKFGKRAKTISFVQASNDIRGLANFMNGGRR